MKLREYWVKWASTIIGALLGEGVGTLLVWTVLGEPFGKSFGFASVFAILCAGLGYLTDYIPRITKKVEETLSMRMSQIIEFACLGTKNGYFEKHLALLRQSDLKSLGWAVAKFISYKLNKDFNTTNKIEIFNVTAK